MNTATKITFARILCVPILIIFVAVRFPYHMLISAIAYVLIALSDTLDGYVARKTNTVTDLGKLLDPMADKFLSIAGMLCCLLSNSFYHLIGFAVAVTLVILRELIISALRLLAGQKGKVLESDVFGKIKTAFINTAIPTVLVAAAFTGYPKFSRVTAIVGSSIFGVGVILTIFSGIRYIVINRVVFRELFVVRFDKKSHNQQNCPSESKVNDEKINKPGLSNTDSLQNNDNDHDSIV